MRNAVTSVNGKMFMSRCTKSEQNQIQNKNYCMISHVDLKTVSHINRLERKMVTGERNGESGKKVKGYKSRLPLQSKSTTVNSNGVHTENALA